MKFSSENRPAVGQVVFYSNRERVIEATVVMNCTHAAFKTPYEQLSNNATLHPEYLFATKAEADASAKCFSLLATNAKNNQSTLESFTLEQSEVGKLNADSPQPQTHYAQNVEVNLEMFKEHYVVGALQKALPHLTKNEAVQRFVEGMQIFRILSDAFAYTHCVTYTKIMSEELKKAKTDCDAVGVPHS